MTRSRRQKNTSFITQAFKKEQKKRKRPENVFERCVQGILESKGYTVINVPMPLYGGHLIDLIAIKNQIAYPIEIKVRRIVHIKGKLRNLNPYYSEQQKHKQMLAFNISNTPFFVIAQSKKEGKIVPSSPNAENIHYDLLSHSGRSDRCELWDDLREWIENE